LKFGKKRTTATYNFSQLSHVWGWASWRRAWTAYDKNLARPSIEEIDSALKQHFIQPHIGENWYHIAADLKAGKIDTWDFQLGLTNILQHGLSIIPSENLIANIGFDARATHTQSTDSHYANLPTGALPDPLVHPVHFVPDRAADLFTLTIEAEKERKHREMVAASLRRDPWLTRKWNRLTGRKNKSAPR
jgi:hypothetical protein